MKKICLLLSLIVIFSQNFISRAEYSKPYVDSFNIRSKGELELIKKLVAEGKISEKEAPKVKILGYVEKELSESESILEKKSHNQDRDSKGLWMQTDGRWWFKYNDGHYSVDWDKIDGKWYYFDKDGWMKSNEWIQPDGHWYYLTNSGAMAVGLFEVKGKNYFFRDNGICAENDGIAISLYGQTFVGNISYVFGANDLSYHGRVDCSSFTQLLHRTFGHYIDRTAEEQLYCGTSIIYGNALPGDIVCYSGHVGIYIGDGKIVHAANEDDDVMISNARGLTNKFLDVRRCWK